MTYNVFGGTLNLAQSVNIQDWVAVSGCVPSPSGRTGERFKP